MTGGLLERDEELKLLRSRVDAAVDGRGGLAMLEGAAGSGKTALLGALREQLRTEELRVCVAVGGELERDFPFGIVRQLLEPVARGLGPERRASLLTGAAESAAQLLLSAGPATTAAPDGTFTTLHGLYWFTAGLAEEKPLVLLVDDAHWSDEASLRCLDFLARRAPELPLLIVLGARPDEPGAPQQLLAGLADAAGETIVRPAPLSEEAVRTLVSDGLGAEPGDEVIAAAAQSTGGNPLLLRALIRTLADDGTAPTARAVREAVPASVVRSVGRRLTQISPAARRTAYGLAVLGRGSELSLLAATTAQDETTALDGLRELRGMGLVEDHPPRYAHPLVRAAVAETIPAAERAQLHRAAADHLRRDGRQLDDLLLHVLALPRIAERWAVDALTAGARQAAAEGAGEAAVRRLRRAREEAAGLGLPTDEIDLGLGTALLSQGEAPAGIERLDAAVASPRATVAAEALRIVLGSGYYHDLAILLARTERADEVLAQLDREGHQLPAGRLEAQIYATFQMSSHLSDRRVARLEALHEHPTPDIDSLLGFEHCNRGAARSEVVTHTARLLSAAPLSRIEDIEQPLMMYGMEAAFGVDARDGWAEALAPAEVIVRRSGSPMAAALYAYISAEWLLVSGSVASAEARARQALDHFASYGASTIQMGIRGCIVSALVRRGQLEEAERVDAEPSADDPQLDHYGGLFVFNRRAELRMAQGRPLEAIADLRRLGELLSSYRWTRFCQGYGTQLLARALALTGQREEGLALAEAEVADAERREVPGALTQALISLGHAAPGPARSLEAFAAAHEAAGQGAASFVKALAAYEFGAALRRTGQRTDARTKLTQAREEALRTDSGLLADAAGSELVVAGGRPRRVRASGVEALTPSERRVAEHAAAGLSNREIAETLFVTRKTVELHLGNAFGKLGIGSRTQLPAIFAGEGQPQAG